MREIRLHGRAGQGIVMTAEILAVAFAIEGKEVAAMPLFGVERRGAPVVAFLRFDDKYIDIKTMIYHPDCLVVSTPHLMIPSTFAGLRAGGILVLNAPRLPEENLPEGLRLVGVVDATRIALEEIGIPIPNTCILGTFARTTGWLGLDSILSSLKEYFSGNRLEKNIRCATRGFQEVEVKEISKVGDK